MRMHWRRQGRHQRRLAPRQVAPFAVNPTVRWASGPAHPHPHPLHAHAHPHPHPHCHAHAHPHPHPTVHFFFCCSTNIGGFPCCQPDSALGLRPSSPSSSPSSRSRSPSSAPSLSRSRSPSSSPYCSFFLLLQHQHWRISSPSRPPVLRVIKHLPR